LLARKLVPGRGSVQVTGAGARALAVDMAGHGLRARRTADPGRILAPYLVAHVVYLTVDMPASGVPS
jgi:hypothetical protein